MRPPYLEICLLSLGVLLFEVAYTRVFSFKLVYYFTYVVIGMAMLGLGASAVCVTIFPRLRRARAERLIPTCALAAGTSVLLGYGIVAATPLNAIALVESVASIHGSTLVLEGAKLALVCVCLFAPFFAAGVAIASVLATDASRAARLYAADLLGAGLGCALAVPLMGLLSPPGCVMAAGLAFVAAGLRLTATRWRPLLAPSLCVGGLLVLGVLWPGRLPDPVPDRVKNVGKTLFSRWSPVFRIDVLPGLDADRLLVLHDGMLGSILHRFGGDLAFLGHFKTDERSAPFAVLGSSARVAIIGAAGGHEILASLYFGASHVTAVELNPVTTSLLTDHFADYTGRLADNPRVRLVTGEGRSFLRRDPARYDLIWFVAPDSYAAMNAATSGAFVLSESYLYTVEMILESVAHLSAGGIVCVQFGEIDFEAKPNRTVRYLATAREAFRRLGVGEFERHVLVSTTPGLWATATILLKRSPFTLEEVRRFRAGAAVVPGTVVRHAPDAPPLVGPVGQVVSLPGAVLESWYREYPFEVRPVTDDAPFFWHFVPFRHAFGRMARYGKTFFEEGTGERLLLGLLIATTIFAACAMLGPLVATGPVWRAMPGKLPAGLFFAAIGIGFMFLEVALIQRLTLFLGYPTYSLTVTLCALLVSTGIGSLASGRGSSERSAGLLGLAGVLGALVLFTAYGLPVLLARAVGWPFPARVTLAAVSLLPLGICLGSFMPIGLRRVAGLPGGEAFVAWAWAVNAFFSVVSSVLATILAMAFGFQAVMLSALAVYFVGIAALRRVSRGGAAPSRSVAAVP